MHQTTDTPPVPTTASPHVRVVHVAGAGTLHGAELPLLADAGAAAEHPPTPAHVTTRREGDRLDVVLAGDVDPALASDLGLALAFVRSTVRDGGPQRVRRVHLDVAAVTALDTTALRWVEDLRGACAQAAVACSTSPARPAVQRVLDLVRALPDGELAAS
ncbi:hypothetical protein [Kineococcus sp. NPDC059986]|uniref:STAS domain-containing protein n=1 Tax=Kineococcus sp. NPDC059986 TaxID=3155538 RepID=UPI00344B831D